jgi:hypothetical protein
VRSNSRGQQKYTTPHKKEYQNQAHAKRGFRVHVDREGRGLLEASVDGGGYGPAPGSVSPLLPRGKPEALVPFEQKWGGKWKLDLRLGFCHSIQGGVENGLHTRLKGFRATVESTRDDERASQADMRGHETKKHTETHERHSTSRPKDSEKNETVTLYHRPYSHAAVFSPSSLLPSPPPPPRFSPYLYRGFRSCLRPPLPVLCVPLLRRPPSPPWCGWCPRAPSPHPSHNPRSLHNTKHTGQGVRGRQSTFVGG